MYPPPYPPPVQAPSPAWQKRFAFFAQFGQPAASAAGREAFKRLGFWERGRLNFNILAFLFGPIYFAIKGPWRKGLTILGGSFALLFVLSFFPLPDLLFRALGFGVAAVYASTANWAYFLHVARGSTSWNPFEDMPMVRSKN